MFLNLQVCIILKNKQDIKKLQKISSAFLKNRCFGTKDNIDFLKIDVVVHK